MSTPKYKIEPKNEGGEIHMESNKRTSTRMLKRIAFLVAAILLFVSFWLNRYICSTKIITTDILVDLILKALMCMILIICVQYVNYRIYYYYSAVLYLVSLLLIVLLGTSYGVMVDGVTKWLSIGGVELQITEVAKFVIVLSLAYVVHLCSERNESRKVMLGYMSGAGIIMSELLMLFSCDWQTVFIIVAVTIGMLFLYNQGERLKNVVFYLTLISLVIGIIKAASCEIIDAMQLVGHILIQTTLCGYISLYAVRTGTKVGSVYGRAIAYAIALQFVLQLLLNVVTAISVSGMFYEGMSATLLIPEIGIILSIERRNQEEKKWQ